MSTSVRVITSRDFIRATPDGVPDIKRAEDLLAEISRRGESLEDFEVLIDTRQVKGMLTAGELWYLSEQLAKYRRAFSRRTAVLCPVEKFDHTRFFALCAENHGLNVRAFDSYEDAMEWLIGDAGGGGTSKAH
jgi:hypothetical protein